MQRQKFDLITEDMILNSPETYIYIFGDNLEHRGFGGQAAVARQFVKEGRAFGITTKRKPSNTDDSYFSDRKDEIDAVRKSFTQIRIFKKMGRKIIFFPHIGEGLSDLQRRSPMIYGMIRGFIESFNGD